MGQSKSQEARFRLFPPVSRRKQAERDPLGVKRGYPLTSAAIPQMQRPPSNLENNAGQERLRRSLAR